MAGIATFSSELDDIDFKFSDRKFESFKFLISHKYDLKKLNNKKKLSDIANELLENDEKDVLKIIKNAFLVIGRLDIVKLLFPDYELDKIPKWPKPLEHINVMRELIFLCWLEILDKDEDAWKEALIKNHPKFGFNGSQNVFSILDTLMTSNSICKVADLKSLLPGTVACRHHIFQQFIEDFDLKEDDHLPLSLWEPKLPTNYYKITKGLLLVINDDTREGSEIDLKLIQDTFSSFSYNQRPMFDIRSHNYGRKCSNDADALEMFKRSVSCLLNDSYDCLILFIMAHGNEVCFRFKLPENRISVPKKSIYNVFTASDCPQLAGKPKLFFIQSCRGDKPCSGISIPSDTLQTDGPGETFNTQTPQPPKSQQHVADKADCFKMEATTSSAVAYRDRIEGSPFIKSLCDNIKSYGKRRHISELHLNINLEYSEELSTKHNRFIVSPLKSTLKKNLVLLRHCD